MNRIALVGTLSKGPLRDYEVIVDPDDYEALMQFTWRVSISGRYIYALRRQKRKTIYMHRIIMNAPDGILVTHLNGNGLDNRKENLRLFVNARNFDAITRISLQTSDFMGVYLRNTVVDPWVGCVIVQGQTKFNRCFSTENEASLAVKEIVTQLMNEGIVTNHFSIRRSR